MLEGTDTRPMTGAARMLALVVLSVCALLAFGASGADAVIVHIKDGQTVSYLPDLHAHPASFGALALARGDGGSGGGLSGTGRVSYHGGPVMSSNTDYAFYWAPGGAPEYPAGYITGTDRYFEDLALDSGRDTNDDSVAAQYNDAEGEYAEYEAKFGGAIVDTDPYPSNGCHRAAICLTNEQLVGELQTYLAAHHLPENLTTGYYILTPPEAESCFEAAGLDCSAGTSEPEYCAYHGYFQPEGQTVLYADDPYSTGVEGCDTGKHPSESIAEGTLQGGLAHEHLEMVSDPTLRSWFNSANGEISDICRTFELESELGPQLGTAPDGAPYNQLINGHQYLYQQVWSNETNACAQRRTWPVPAISSISPKGGLSQGGTIVKINGTELRNTKAVYFGPVASPSVKVLSATSVEAESPGGAAGYTHITLVTGHGTSVETPSSLFKYGPPSIAALTPNHGPHAGGARVTATGSGFGAGTTFTFARVAASEVECASTTTCTFTVPPRAKAGTVVVHARSDEKRSPSVPPGDEYHYE